jgi:hypothetical protein
MGSGECFGRYVEKLRRHFQRCKYPRVAGRVVDVGVLFTVCEMVYLMMSS